MDLVTTAIVAVLTGDHATGAEVGNATAEAYDALKNVLKQKFGVDSSLIEAIELFEKRPDSAVRQKVLKEEVATIEADQAPEVVAAAQALLDQIRRARQPQDNSNKADAAQPVDSPYVPLQRPAKTDHFTGRQAELAQLLNTLQPGRVVTLCGPGGVGKSALAAKAVWTLAPESAPPELFPNGIIYHNFYTQPQVNLALERIAHAFGEEIRPTPQAAAGRALATHKVLLVLDGAEQAGDLTKILDVRGESGVLVTSRNRKDAVDERQDIEPMPVEEAVGLLELEAWGWIRSSDKTTAQEICRLVGGLPLSVRLVGRYLVTRKQMVNEYLRWLQKTPLPNMNQRQRCEQSVPLLLERSLARVGETAQLALAVAGLLALAPFGQDVIAAALAKGNRGFFGTIQKLFRQQPPESATEVSLALDKLVNYGLLRWVGRGYQVSQVLIHTYAQNRIATPAGAMERLVSYYTTLVGEQILLGLDGYSRLDAERPHLMTVLTRCIEQKNWEAAHNLAAAIEDYLDLQGYWTERVLANESGLTAARKLTRWNETAWLGNLGLAYSNVGQPERAIEYYEQALSLARKNGDRRSEGNWLGNLGLAYRDMEQIDRARQYLQQSVAIFDDIKSPSADLIRDWLAEFEEA